MYKKLKPSIWTYNYEFSILYYWIEESGAGNVFKFRLTLVTEAKTDDAVAVDLSSGRFIPSSVN